MRKMYNHLIMCAAGFISLSIMAGEAEVLQKAAVEQNAIEIALSDHDYDVLKTGSGIDFVYVPRGIKELLRNLFDKETDNVVDENIKTWVIPSDLSIAPQETMKYVMEHVVGLESLSQEERQMVEGYIEALRSGDAQILRMIAQNKREVVSKCCATCVYVIH